MPDLLVRVDDRTFEADWTDGNPATRRALAAALPLSGDAARWGDELYFRTPVDVPAEDARVEVPIGGVAYWPDGNALCVFWGPTPASTDGTPAAASPVNLVALLREPSGLASLSGGARVVVEAADG